MKFNNKRSGCRDVFHAFLVENAKYDGALEIPRIMGTTSVPNKLIVFSKSLRTNDYNQWMHFYEDDYQFERLWNNPRRYLPILCKFNGVILPDFSLYRDMPLAMQVWNIYRSRAIGTWLEQNGVEVIPNIRFGDERTYDISCMGISQNLVISIGSIGCVKSKTDRHFLIEGTVNAINRLKPSVLIIYGSLPKEIYEYCLTTNITVITFDGETKKFFEKEAV